VELEGIAMTVFPRLDEGIDFVTPGSSPLQVGRMLWPSGHKIKPHYHTQNTREVLFVRTGIVRADLYDRDQRPLRSVYLHPGDVILLHGGGHGFEMITDAEIVEVKTGPYVDDKVRFDDPR
jgi:hypothetical protein